MTPVDEDALSVMKQAGQDFAAKQIGRWSNNEWGNLGPDMQDERMNHWRAVKERIGEIIGLIKQEMKERQ